MWAERILWGVFGISVRLMCEVVFVVSLEMYEALFVDTFMSAGRPVR